MDVQHHGFTTLSKLEEARDTSALCDLVPELSVCATQLKNPSIHQVLNSCAVVHVMIQATAATLRHLVHQCNQTSPACGYPSSHPLEPVGVVHKSALGSLNRYWNGAQEVDYEG